MATEGSFTGAFFFFKQHSHVADFIAPWIRLPLSSLKKFAVRKSGG